jgi:SnoaL-like domain
MPATPVHDELADRLVALLERGSPEEIVDRLAPGAVLWHNDDKHATDAVGGVAAVEGLHALVDDVRIEVLERNALPDGFVQRYVIHGTVKHTGTALAAHHWVFVRTDGAHITRIDEYVDPTLAIQLGLVTPQEVSS